MDTDSFHIALAHSTLDKCILPNKKQSWDLSYLKYFNPAGISCVMMEENKASCATYYAGN